MNAGDLLCAGWLDADTAADNSQATSGVFRCPCAFPFEEEYYYPPL